MSETGESDSLEQRYEQLVVSVGPRLRRALTSAFGPQVGEDAAAEAIALGWVERARVVVMVNPGGYLFTVGRNAANRTSRRRIRIQYAAAVHQTPSVEPRLPDALASLSDRQRAVVLLLDGYDWKVVEVAEMLGLSESAVRTHHSRALHHLRAALGVEQ